LFWRPANIPKINLALGRRTVDRVVFSGGGRASVVEALGLSL
jgi:hypothetical protein